MYAIRSYYGYGFGQGHPFGTERVDVFWSGLEAAGLADRVAVCPTAVADAQAIERFHTDTYVALVAAKSHTGSGFLA